MNNNEEQNIQNSLNNHFEQNRSENPIPNSQSNQGQPQTRPIPHFDQAPSSVPTPNQASQQSQAPQQRPIPQYQAPNANQQAPNQVQQPPRPSQPVAPLAESVFDGKMSQWLGWRLLGGLVTSITCGICAPWAFCMMYRWEIDHTTINGRRLKFSGTGGQLIGKWIKWMLLSLITCGIYALWIPVKLNQWKVEHTSFER